MRVEVKEEEARKGFLQLLYVSGQLYRRISCFKLLKQIMDWLMTGMLKFPSRHFMTSLSVAMVAKTFLKHTLKSQFFKCISEIN